ncbi:uncharacterized protein JCM6883_006511 [Sporobolomyces salmoneus]|uniref:uncharacterized protein n=1 Tax=Sporobolomyces salmoneus TaxID=183962 RepID=UPI003170D387
MGAQQSTPTNAAVPPPGCPMHEKPAPPPPSESASKCPIDHSSSTPFNHAPRGQVNELNNIPDLAQQPSPGQKVDLPLERTISSIPRASSSSSAPPASCPVAHASKDGSIPSPPSNENGKGVDQWEYPSPQQFYNALVRKGWETPEESVEMMVNIHNWLNEEAWSQVRRWEEKHDGGAQSSLASFQGRPQELSPKARYHLFMGKILPNYYASVRPFDRHDWIVHRPAVVGALGGGSSYMSGGQTTPYTSHRYVIDYYHLADDQEGNPVFSLDVRPAVDDLGAVKERVEEWWKLKKENLFGSASSGGDGTPGVRVQEN